MQQLIQSKGMAAGSLYKFLYTGLVFSLGPLLIIAGIFNLFGMSFITFTFNEQVLTGTKAFIMALIMAPLFPLILAAILWLFILVGVWIFTRFTTLDLNIKVG